MSSFSVFLQKLTSVSFTFAFRKDFDITLVPSAHLMWKLLFLYQAITVSDNWAAIATTTRTLRIFSIGGLQRHVFTLPGDVVALASHRDKLLIVYHRGLSPVLGDQCMGVYLMRVGHGSKLKVLINAEALPLSRASKLAWLG